MNPNAQIEIKAQKFFPQGKIGTGPSYSIPSQAYPSRQSPIKETTPRNETARAASSQSPNNNNLISQRTISAVSDCPDATPGCTDYSPNHCSILKKEPGYAIQHAQRFYEPRSFKDFPSRPHVYEDPNKRTFRRSNSGSFTRAPRFKSPLDTGTIKAYLLQLNERKTETGGMKSMSNLNSKNTKFKFSSRNASLVSTTRDLR